MELLEGKELPGVTALDAAPAPTRRKILGGNWKSNPGSVQAVRELCGAFSAATFDATKIECVLFPTTLHGPHTQAALANSGMEVGVQNISKTGNGAFTGEISAEQIKDFGLEWAIIGHSERRNLFGEDDALVATKVGQA